MKIQYKTALILILTLLVGMVLGALIHGAVMRDRFEQRIFRMRTDEGFSQRMEGIIEPDDSQKKAMREIVRKHFRRMSEHQKEFRSMMDSLKVELDSILTDEQKKRLEQRLGLPGGRPPGPPFGRRQSEKRGSRRERPDSSSVPF
ncbi:MAG: hypothetical protein ABIL68_15710 [bacterium]